MKNVRRTRREWQRWGDFDVFGFGCLGALVTVWGVVFDGRFCSGFSRAFAVRSFVFLLSLLGLF